VEKTRKRSTGFENFVAFENNSALFPVNEIKQILKLETMKRISTGIIRGITIRLCAKPAGKISRNIFYGIKIQRSIVILTESIYISNSFCKIRDLYGCFFNRQSAKSARKYQISWFF
jgi:hypothetical protein